MRTAAMRPNPRQLNEPHLSIVTDEPSSRFFNRVGRNRTGGSCRCPHHRSSRLNVAGLVSRRKATRSEHGSPVGPNLVDRQFGVQQADRIWIADMRYIATTEGWLYLAAVLDLGNSSRGRLIDGARMPAQLECDTLAMAYFRRRPRPG